MTRSELVEDADPVMDVRPVPCAVKRRQVLQAWRDLRVGDCFVLVNDCDPVPLYHLFSAEWTGLFRWERKAKGPDEFRVRITKLGDAWDRASVRREDATASAPGRREAWRRNGN